MPWILGITKDSWVLIFVSASILLWYVLQLPRMMKIQPHMDVWCGWGESGDGSVLRLNMSRGGAQERGRRRIWSRLQALSCQHRAWSGARTREPWDHDLSWSQTLNRLSHPGTPESLFLILWDIYLGVELLGHMIIVCLAFWGVAKLFSTVSIQFYIPLAMLKGSDFSTSSATVVTSRLFWQ